MKKLLTDKRIVLLLLIFLHLLIIPFLINPGLIYQNYFLALLLTVSVVFCYSQLRNDPAPSDHFLTKFDWLSLLCILVISGILSALQLHTNSIWLDEYEELLNVLNYPDLLYKAATFQQPPLSYFLRKLGVMLGGPNELGIRISSVIGNALFLIVMFFNIRRLTRDSFYANLSTILLSFNYWIILYSVEGRPYAISLFYFAVFLHFLISGFQESRGRNFLNYGLILATLFWLLSISMQPLIFVGWGALAAVIGWFPTRNVKLLAVAAALGVALLLYLPFLSPIMASSSAYLQAGSRPLSAYFEAYFNDLYLLKTMFLHNNFYFFIILQMFFLTVIALVVGKAHRLRLRAFAGFSIIYVFLIIFLLEYKINWPLSERYFITTVPLMYLLFFAGLFYFREAKFMYLKKAVLFQLVAIAFISYLYAKPFQKYGRNWRGLYSETENLTDKTAKAFIFSFRNTAGGWTDEFFVASELYPSNKVLFPAPGLYNFPVFTNNDFLFNNFGPESNQEELFFIIDRNSFKDTDFERLNIKGTQKTTLEGFFIIKANPPLSLLTMTKEFYSQLENISDDTEIRLRAFDGLYLTALFEKNCGKLKHYLTKYAEIAQAMPVHGPKVNLHRARYRSQCGNGS